MTKEQIVAFFRKISRRTGTIAMTTAERLINEGIEKGIEHGIEQATVRHVKGMLKLGMDAKTIAAALEESIDRIHTLIEQIRSGRI